MFAVMEGCYMNNRRVKKQKLNRKKIILSIVIIFLLVICLIMIMGNGNTLSHTEMRLKTIFVSSGETLWEIATIESQNNEYYAKCDIRFIVKDIKKINSLETSSLYEGQQLFIPEM